ncbi:MAG: hypothetical protein ABIJ23_00355 [Candidatus Magasanikbacteria bacterium]
MSSFDKGDMENELKNIFIEQFGSLRREYSEYSDKMDKMDDNEKLAVVDKLLEKFDYLIGEMEKTFGQNYPLLQNVKRDRDLVLSKKEEATSMISGGDSPESVEGVQEVGDVSEVEPLSGEGEGDREEQEEGEFSEDSFKTQFGDIRREFDSLPDLDDKELLPKLSQLDNRMDRLVGFIEDARSGDNTPAWISESLLDKVVPTSLGIKSNIDKIRKRIDEDNIRKAREVVDQVPDVPVEEPQVDEENVSVEVASAVQPEVEETESEAEVSDVEAESQEEKREKAEKFKKELRENGGEIVKIVDSILERGDLPEKYEDYTPKDQRLSKLRVDVKDNLKKVKSALMDNNKFDEAVDREGNSEFHPALTQLYSLTQADIGGNLGQKISELEILFKQRMEKINLVIAEAGKNYVRKIDIIHPEKGALFNESLHRLFQRGDQTVRDLDPDVGFNSISVTSEPGISYEDDQGKKMIVRPTEVLLNEIRNS